MSPNGITPYIPNAFVLLLSQVTSFFIPSSLFYNEYVLLFLLLSNHCCCSVTQSCLTLCDPMDCSTTGFPFLHHLLELAQHHSSKASVLQHSVFFMVQLSHPYMTAGETTALTRQTFGFQGNAFSWFSFDHMSTLFQFLVLLFFQTPSTGKFQGSAFRPPFCSIFAQSLIITSRLTASKTIPMQITTKFIIQYKSLTRILVSYQTM